MSNSTYLSKYPDLENWFFHKGKNENKNNMFRLCACLNHSSLDLVTRGIAKYFQEQSKQSPSDIVHSLEDLESDLAKHKVNLNNIVVQVVEESLMKGLHQSLYDSIANVAKSTKLSTFCFIAAWISLNDNRLEDCISFSETSECLNSDFYGLKGQALLELNLYEQALICFENATEHAPKEPLHWFWLAKCSFALGLEIEALLAAQACQELTPHNVEACTLLGVIACEINSNSEHLQKAWNTLYEQIDTLGNIASFCTILFSLGIKLNDEDRTRNLIHKLNFSKLAQSNDFSECSAEILSQLSKKSWPNTEKFFKDKYYEAIQD